MLDLIRIINIFNSIYNYFLSIFRCFFRSGIFYLDADEKTWTFPSAHRPKNIPKQKLPFQILNDPAESIYIFYILSHISPGRKKKLSSVIDIIIIYAYNYIGFLLIVLLFCNKEALMDINYELYKVFYQVASSLSFSEASRKLFISQSAVSQSIKTLERKLEQPLFIRSTKKVKLTLAGELLLKHIEPAVNLIERGEHQLIDSSALGLGRLHIGANDTICRYFLVPFLKQFHEKFPQVPIKVTNATSLRCADLLTQGKVDLIVTNFPNSRINSSYIQKTVASFTDVFIANPSCFPFEQQTVSFAKLNQCPILMLDKKCATSEFLQHLFLQHQLELIPEAELSSNDLLIDLAKIGIGIAFIPDYCLTKDMTDLCILKTEEPMPARRIVAAVNSSLPLSPSAGEFLKLLPTYHEEDLP